MYTVSPEATFAQHATAALQYVKTHQQYSKFWSSVQGNDHTVVCRGRGGMYECVFTFNRDCKLGGTVSGSVVGVKVKIERVSICLK